MSGAKECAQPEGADRYGSCNALLPAVPNEYEPKSGQPLYNDLFFIRISFPTGLSCPLAAGGFWPGHGVQASSSQERQRLRSTCLAECTQPGRSRCVLGCTFRAVPSSGLRVHFLQEKKIIGGEFICNFHLHWAYSWRALQHPPCTISSLFRYLIHWVSPSQAFFKRDLKIQCEKEASFFPTFFPSGEKGWTSFSFSRHERAERIPA